MREDISSDNQETHEEVKCESINDISTENIITSPDIQEEKCKINNYHNFFNKYYLSHFQHLKMILLLLIILLLTHLIHKNKRNVSITIMYLYLYWIT